MKVTGEVKGRRRQPEPPNTKGNEEFAADSLRRFSDWAKFADAKAGAVLVLLGLLLAGLLSRVSDLLKAYQLASRWGDWATGLTGAALLAAAITVVLVSLALFPRTKPTTSSLAFFGDVAKMKAEAYQAAVRALDANAVVDHYANQAWEVSRIASTKFTFSRWAYRSAILFLVLTVAARLCYWSAV